MAWFWTWNFLSNLFSLNNFRFRLGGIPQIIRCTYQGCGSGRIRTILVRKIFSGSGSYRYFGNVKLYKQGKNKKYFKKEVLHIFRWIFPFFQIKIIIVQTSEEICLMWKKFRCLNWFLVSASRIRIRKRIQFLKFWFAGSGSGRKWTGSATLILRYFSQVVKSVQCTDGCVKAS